MEEFEWSNYQKAIFKELKEGHESILVKARAGAAKSTTICHGVQYYLPENKSCLLVAFNKRIADELKRKIPEKLDSNNEFCISTIHSLGLRSISKTFRGTNVNADKGFEIITSLIGDNKKDNELKYSLRDAVNLAKNTLSISFAEIDDMMDSYDFEPFPSIDRKKYIEHMIKAMDLAKENVRQVDFSDMLFLPNVLPVLVPKYHIVMVDEGQDLSNSQLSLVKQTLNKDENNKFTSRCFMFMDEFQNIYKFNGSCPIKQGEFVSAINAKPLPLSISYRCPKAVVKLAQRLVPSIECSPTAQEGLVQTINYNEMMKLAEPGCFILSRINAPLIGLCMSFIKNGKRASISGREIGTGLLKLVKRSKAKKLPDLIQWVKSWEEKEIDRLKDKGKDFEQIVDRAECLYSLISHVKTVDELKSNLQTLFEDTDDTNSILLSSVHRAKGLERNVVFLINNTFRYNNQQEKNIVYVAQTRSKSQLYIVQKDKVKKDLVSIPDNKRFVMSEDKTKKITAALDIEGWGDIINSSDVEDDYFYE